MEKHICIVSPALAKANNGNWQTAQRWARFLRRQDRFSVALSDAWPSLPIEHGTAVNKDSSNKVGLDKNTPHKNAPDLLIALHARRSAPALAAFHKQYPARPSILVLTGTDLYRDIQTDPQAQEALQQASALVLLQPAGFNELKQHFPALAGKASVIYQSAPTLQPAVRAARWFTVIQVGHLRAEKDPATFMRASSLVTLAKVHMLHIGGALEHDLGAMACATAAAQPQYRWLGNLAHGATRQRLKRSHLMAITSLMEGGANVIIEAVTSGVPVVASDISGNRGMLGADYCGYFPAGDALALAQLIERCMAEPAFYAKLQAQCALRAQLFAPALEQASLQQLVDNLLLRNASTNSIST